MKTAVETTSCEIWVYQYWTSLWRGFSQVLYNVTSGNSTRYFQFPIRVLSLVLCHVVCCVTSTRISSIPCGSMYSFTPCLESNRKATTIMPRVDRKGLTIHWLWSWNLSLLVCNKHITGTEMISWWMKCIVRSLRQKGIPWNENPRRLAI